MEHPSPPRPATPSRLRERVPQGETRASSGCPAPSSLGRDPAAGRERSRWLMLSLRRRQEEGGAGFRGMADDVELEEGEACSDDDGIGFVDPDVTLSYIDEKLQHVLGHFRKDFEGGVSAEKLGPTFGGYGTFLPTYQRSPTPLPPSTRGSPMVANIASPRSPYQQPAEILGQNLSTVAVESICRNNGTTAPSSGDICKEKICSSKNDDKDSVVVPSDSLDS